MCGLPLLSWRGVAGGLIVSCVSRGFVVRRSLFVDVRKKNKNKTQRQERKMKRRAKRKGKGKAKRRKREGEDV